MLSENTLCSLSLNLEHIGVFLESSFRVDYRKGVQNQRGGWKPCQCATGSWNGGVFTDEWSAGQIQCHSGGLGGRFGGLIYTQYIALVAQTF